MPGSVSAGWGEGGGGVVGAAPQVGGQLLSLLVFLTGVGGQRPAEQAVQGAAVQVVGGFDQVTEDLRPPGQDDGDGHRGDGEADGDGQGGEGGEDAEQQPPDRCGDGVVEAAASGEQFLAGGVGQPQPQPGPQGDGVQAVLGDRAAFGGAQDVADRGGQEIARRGRAALAAAFQPGVRGEPVSYTHLRAHETVLD